MALTRIIVEIVFAVAGYTLVDIIYNVLFHPLARFPGPWWAGASYLPELYFDAIKGGLYFKEVEKMHKRYGPLVRVNPEQLSIIDPEAQTLRYGGPGTKRDKDARFVRQTASPTSAFATRDHDLHHIRRAPLNKFFSTQAITRLEPLIQSKVDKMVQKLKDSQGTVLATMDVFGALTTDIISHYTYGESFGFLDNGQQNFRNEYLRNISSFMKAAPYLMHYPILKQIMMAVPDRILAYLSSGAASMIEIINTSKGYARNTLASRATAKELKAMRLRPRTIFQALNNPDIPAKERSFERLTDEGVLIVVAGLETTARFLTNITCHLLSNPEVLRRLKAELLSAMPTPDARPRWKALERLPYLSAVINEGLRCEQILTFRATRVIREPVQYKDWTIPSKTVLSASLYLLNNNADIFRDPQAFRPERWLEADACGENLHKYLATFARGSRGCVGMNLAKAELYLTTAAIFRNFEMDLVDSSVKNVIAARSFLLGFTENNTFGIKVKVTKVHQE